MADKASRQLNPIFGHRGLAIARSYHQQQQQQHLADQE
jgi:hypothetical protein